MRPHRGLVWMSGGSPSPMEGLARLARATGRPLLDLAEPVPSVRIGLPRLPASRAWSYPDTRGDARLRDSIAARENSKYALNVSAEHITVTNGASEALSIILLCVLSRGCRVLIQAPALAFYAQVVHRLGADAVPVRHPERLTAAQLRQARALLLHCPSNPTGVVYAQSTLTRLARECERARTFLILDQVYDEFLYESARSHEPRAVLAHGWLVKVNSVSKTFGAPGLRIGWITASGALSRAFAATAETLRIGVSGLSQEAALHLLRSPLDLLSGRFARSRAALVDALRSGLLRLILPRSPDGGLFCWARVVKPGWDARRLCRHAIRRAEVVLLPGTAFWPPCPRHVRIVFARPVPYLHKAVARLRGSFERDP